MASNLSVPLLNSVSNGKSNSSLVYVYGNECDRVGQRNDNTVYPQRSADFSANFHVSKALHSPIHACSENRSENKLRNGEPLSFDSSRYLQGMVWEIRLGQDSKLGQLVVAE